MKCLECGYYVGHAPDCPLNSKSFGSPIKPFEDLFPDDRKDDFLRDPIKSSSVFDKIPDIPKYEPGFLRNKLEPLKPPKYSHRPLPWDDPLQKTKDPVFLDPMKDKPYFGPPLTGIVKHDSGIDTGIRFTDGGLIKNDMGVNLGKLDGNLIYNDSGHLVGKVAHDGRIIDTGTGYFTGEYIDKNIKP